MTIYIPEYKAADTEKVTPKIRDISIINTNYFTGKKNFMHILVQE